MPSQKLKRKEFLKNAGLALGGLVTSGFTTSRGADLHFSDLSQEQQDFLLEYAGWLKEFNALIEKQKEDKTNPETQKLLMDLALEADQRRPQLEHFMKDENFATYYLALTNKLSKSIS